MTLLLLIVLGDKVLLLTQINELETKATVHLSVCRGSLQDNSKMHKEANLKSIIEELPGISL